METMMSSKSAATSVARLASSRPVVSSVMRMPSSRRKTHNPGRSPFISGSPPERTTHSTRRRRSDSRCRSISATVIAFVSRRLQMSHITQRQLQRLCTLRTRIGSVATRPAPSSNRTDCSQPCCANMPHSLPAKFDFWTEHSLGFAKESRQPRPDPSQRRIDLQRFKTGGYPVRQSPQDLVRSELHSAANHHHLHIRHCERCESFRRAQPAIAHRDEVDGSIGPQASLSVGQAKGVRCPCEQHFVEVSRRNAELSIRNAHLVKQGSHGGEWRVAA